MSTRKPDYVRPSRKGVARFYDVNGDGSIFWVKKYKDGSEREVAFRPGASASYTFRSGTDNRVIRGVKEPARTTWQGSARLVGPKGHIPG